MKKTILSAVVALMLIASVFSLMGCNGLFEFVTFDEVKKNLTDAGYTVTVIDGKDYVESDANPYKFITEAELVSYLYAVKGENEIHVYYFVSTTVAENNYSIMTNDNLLGGMNNEIVYFATKTARKDAKLF